MPQVSFITDRKDVSRFKEFCLYPYFPDDRERGKDIAQVERFALLLRRHIVFGRSICYTPDTIFAEIPDQVLYGEQVTPSFRTKTYLL